MRPRSTWRTHSRKRHRPASAHRILKWRLRRRFKRKRNPKLSFERPGTDTGTVGRRGTIAMPKPSNTVQEAIRESRSGGSGLTVGDADEGSSAPIPGLRPTPSTANTRSSLQLLSDPAGVDFRPYLVRILSSVRRNWLSVIPESARLGRQGRVVIRFSIHRDGTVENFQITAGSGTDALDRAAVAAVSASQLFPQLPDEFKGGWIRVQLIFKYNME